MLFGNFMGFIDVMNLEMVAKLKEEDFSSFRRFSSVLILGVCLEKCGRSSFYLFEGYLKLGFHGRPSGG